ncbi:hypothetical protein H0A43_00170 [Arcobacter lanthieri]|uniref:hypothetical protein n=1 Tax=Aliarcobacter lanthieri TaxID=1355374 RepID=UPI00192496BC|nr:hypothetical protein [Aliarcobacter lanthieri]MBL3518887.1 hypothetical protein [Aliarcobacter lanthieri]
MNSKSDNKITNYNLLKNLNIDEYIINQIMIRASISSLTKAFIEKLKKLDEKDNPINTILEFFLLADSIKPISCDKKTLSKITGLSERSIDERRRAGKIPFILLSGSNDTGRKTIVYDPIEVSNYLYNEKVKVIA